MVLSVDHSRLRDHSNKCIIFKWHKCILYFLCLNRTPTYAEAHVFWQISWPISTELSRENFYFVVDSLSRWHETVITCWIKRKPTIAEAINRILVEENMFDAFLIAQLNDINVWAVFLAYVQFIILIGYLHQIVWGWRTLDKQRLTSTMLSCVCA